MKDVQGREVKAGYIDEINMSLEREKVAGWFSMEMPESKWIGKVHGLVETRGANEFVRQHILDSMSVAGSLARIICAY